MGREIERKFLVASDDWRLKAPPPRRVRQGYLASGASANVRVRVIGQKAFLTVKSKEPGLIRQEFEYAIPIAEAEEMLAGLCGQQVIEKQRFTLSGGEVDWIIDVFEGRHAGLVLAEVELLATDPRWNSSRQIRRSRCPPGSGPKSPTIRATGTNS